MNAVRQGFQTCSKTCSRIPVNLENSYSSCKLQKVVKRRKPLFPTAYCESERLRGFIHHDRDETMTTKLSNDLRKAIEKEGGSLLHIVDADRNVRYVLMRAELYEKLGALFAEGEEFDPRELYPLMAKSAAAAGWDDPDLDVYNDCDSQKAP